MRNLALTLLLLIAACSESFAPASAVTEFRVVAAKVELPAEPERANPSPDDTVQVSLLPIDRGAPESDDPGVPVFTPAPLTWALVPCIPLPVTIGVPICLNQIAPCDGCLGPPADDPLALPVVTFETPSAEELEAAEASSLLLQGVVCSNGVPSEDSIRAFLMGEGEDLAPCEEGDSTIEGVPVEGRFIAVSIPIENDPEDPNLNPELLSVSVDGFDGEDWPPPYDQGVPRDAPRTGCASDLSEAERAAQPRAGDDASSINLIVTQESLQTFTVGDTELTEEIQVSWLADGGGFERTFSFITAPGNAVLTQWKPSESVPEDGQLVRFNFVIRDGRGGTDWVERGLCILPAE
jgi:hypothetical protein